jgi:hypothetical protein
MKDDEPRPVEPRVLISPSFEASKLDNPTIDDLIDVLEDRVKGWLLDRARAEIDAPNGELAAVSLLLAYFEGTWSFVQGEDSKGKSQVFFRAAFAHVFSPSKVAPELLDRIGGLMYVDARCGLFHDGMVRDHIYVTRQLPQGAPMLVSYSREKTAPPDAIELESIIIDSLQFYRYIEGHFGKYISKLRDPSETVLRANLERMAREKWRIGQAQRTVLLAPGMY